MKKLWLLCIICLTTVGAAKNAVPDKKLEFEIIEEKKYYPLYDSGFVVDSAMVYMFDGDVKVTISMYNKLQKMLKCAEGDSIHIVINSSYRTFEEQYAYRVKNVRKKKYKCDSLFLLTAEDENFKPLTGKPGYSNHNKGIAFDLNTSDKQVYNWLKQNALSFGFVRTVKKEKWHWEYLPETTDMYEHVPKKHWSWR